MVGVPSILIKVILLPRMGSVRNSEARKKEIPLARVLKVVDCREQNRVAPFSFFCAEVRASFGERRFRSPIALLDPSTS